MTLVTVIDHTLTTLPRATLRALAAAAPRSPVEAMGLLRQAGYDGGPEVAAAFERAVRRADDRAPEELPLEDFNERVSEFFAGLGWGRLSITSLHDIVAAVDLAECWEAGVHGQAGGPACHVSTGLMAAFFSHFAPHTLATLEVECAAAGHERCRFLLGQPEVLGDLYESLSRGEDYSTALAQLSDVSASA